MGLQLRCPFVHCHTVKRPYGFILGTLSIEIASFSHLSHIPEENVKIGLLIFLKKRSCVTPLWPHHHSSVKLERPSQWLAALRVRAWRHWEPSKMLLCYWQSSQIRFSLKSSLCIHFHWTDIISILYIAHWLLDQSDVTCFMAAWRLLLQLIFSFFLFCNLILYFFSSMPCLPSYFCLAQGLFGNRMVKQVHENLRVPCGQRLAWQLRLRLSLEQRLLKVSSPPLLKVTSVPLLLYAPFNELVVIQLTLVCNVKDRCY